MKKLYLLSLLLLAINVARAQDFILKAVSDHFSISQNGQGINVYGNDIKDNQGNYFLKSSGSNSTLSWSKITGTPTTLAGYGITDAASYTASNGITQAGNNFSLGGTINNTNVVLTLGTAAAYYINSSLGAAGAGGYTGYNQDSEKIDIGSSDVSIANRAHIYTANTFGPFASIYLNNSSGYQGLFTKNTHWGTGTGLLIQDDIDLKGAYYNADYSANYTARSLIDKGYADGHYSTISGATYTGSNGITQTGNNFIFGGAISQATTLRNSSYDLIFGDAAYNRAAVEIDNSITNGSITLSQGGEGYRLGIVQLSGGGYVSLQSRNSSGSVYSTLNVDPNGISVIDTYNHGIYSNTLYPVYATGQYAQYGNVMIIAKAKADSVKGTYVSVWSSITGKPTTLSGYGIADGVNTSSAQTVGGVKTFSADINAQGNIYMTGNVFSNTGSPYYSVAANDTRYYPITGNPSGFLTSATAPTYTASNGLTQTGNNFSLGGTFTGNQTINTAGFYLGITGSVLPLRVTSTGGGTHELDINGAGMASSDFGSSIGFGGGGAVDLNGDIIHFKNKTNTYTWGALGDGSSANLSYFTHLQVYQKPSALNDVVRKRDVDSLITASGATGTPAWSTVTGKPTTLSGYGITDAYPLSSNPSGFLTGITSSLVTTALGYTPNSGSGTTGYIAKYIGTNTQGNSVLYENSGKILIGGTTATGSTTFQVIGSDIRVNAMTIGRGSGPIGGGGNIVFGGNAFISNVAGESNVAIADAALSANLGSNNIGIGEQALYSNGNTNNNIAIGWHSMLSTTTGNNNSVIGTDALSLNTTGTSNAVFGSNAGKFIADGLTAATIVNNSIFIGASARPLADNQTNQIVIGQGTAGLGSNTTVIGTTSTNVGRWYGRLLLGSNTDNGTDALQVTGNATVNGGLSAKITPTGMAGTDSIVVKHGNSFYAISPTFYGTGSASPAWSSVTATPTTLGGYGITDAVPYIGASTDVDLGANKIYAHWGYFGYDQRATKGYWTIIDQHLSYTDIFGGTGLDIDGATGTSSTVVTGGAPIIFHNAIQSDHTPATGNDLTNKTYVDSKVGGAMPTWSSITGKPTTVSGYGITDAYPLTGNPSGFLTTISGISASGDLSGAYPNPTVSTINGITKSYYDPTSSIQTQLNGKQGTLTLTTTGTSGAATLVGSTINIPQYAGTTYSAGTGVNIASNTVSVDQTFTPSWTGQHTWTNNSASNTLTPYITLKNGTTGLTASGTTYFSPTLSFMAPVWNGSASSTMEFRAYATTNQVNNYGYYVIANYMGGSFNQNVLQIDPFGNGFTTGSWGVQKSGTGTSTTSDGLAVLNFSTSNSGAPAQNSSIIRYMGSVWNTTTSANNWTEWADGIRNTSGASPVSKHWWSERTSTNNSGAYTDLMSLDNTGLLNVTKLGFLSAPATSTTTSQHLTYNPATSTVEQLNGEVILATVTGINAKTVANTNLYTVPTGKTAVITRVMVRCTAASAITAGPTVNVGDSGNGSASIYASTTLSGLTGTTKAYGFSTSGITSLVATGSTISFNLTAGATGTSQTVSVDLIGYLQ